MGSKNAKLPAGLGIGSTIGMLVCHFSRTVRAKKLKDDVFNALHEIGADAELAVIETKEKAVKTGVKVAEKVIDKATEMKDKPTSNS